MIAPDAPFEFRGGPLDGGWHDLPINTRAFVTMIGEVRPVYIRERGRLVLRYAESVCTDEEVRLVLSEWLEDRAPKAAGA